MSIACSTNLGSPTINQSPMTLKAFDKRSFLPYDILNDFTVEQASEEKQKMNVLLARYVDYLLD